MSAAHPVRLRILRSGSSGNAIYVDAAQTRVLIDAGLPAEAVARALDALPVRPQELTAILLTHEHDDHARGAAALAKLAGAPILANEGTIRSAGPLLAGARVERFVTLQPFRVGALWVDAFPLPHDAAEPVGFVLRADGLQLVIATDLGAGDAALIERVRTADVVVLEANYDLRLLSVSPYPWFLKNRIASPTGHLSNDAAADVLVRAAPARSQRVILVHLSDINNLTPLARDTVRWALQREGMTHVAVDAIRPHSPSPLYEWGGP